MAAVMAARVASVPPCIINKSRWDFFFVRGEKKREEKKFGKTKLKIIRYIKHKSCKSKKARVAHRWSTTVAEHEAVHLFNPSI